MKSLLTHIPRDWKEEVQARVDEESIRALFERVYEAYQNEVVYPPQEDIFRALALCPLLETKVVILGQDPYHGKGQAQGLAFSVRDGVAVPPSLRNIFKELQDDMKVPLPSHGNLEAWAAAGVLLLNTTLTVRGGEASSHRTLGWERFTDALIAAVSQQHEHVVFILWGAHAIGKEHLIDHTRHCILKAPHPSPLSAYRGFFGSRPFSKTNHYLQAHGKAVIRW